MATKKNERRTPAHHEVATWGGREIVDREVAKALRDAYEPSRTILTRLPWCTRAWLLGSLKRLEAQGLADHDGERGQTKWARAGVRPASDVAGAA